MNLETIEVERRERVEYVTLNRPEKLNALNKLMIKELRAYFDGLYLNQDVRIVVLKGAGRGFLCRSRSHG